LPRPRRNAPPELTPQQRRQQIVTILSAALTAMPPAAAIPHESGPENSLEFSLSGLELLGESRLSVPTG
jgi:hypothetical protein